MKYVKKPDTIEAFEVQPSTIIKDLPRWLTIYWGPDSNPPLGQIKLVANGAIVGTFDGPTSARWSDFIVYKGWTQPCSGVSVLDVINGFDFYAQYEPVSE